MVFVITPLSSRFLTILLNFALLKAVSCNNCFCQSSLFSARCKSSTTFCSCSTNWGATAFRSGFGAPLRAGFLFCFAARSFLRKAYQVMAAPAAPAIEIPKASQVQLVSCTSGSVTADIAKLVASFVFHVMIMRWPSLRTSLGFGVR